MVAKPACREGEVTALILVDVDKVVGRRRVLVPPSLCQKEAAGASSR